MKRKVVIGIHGMGNKPPADVLSDWWLESLREGLRNHGLPVHWFRFDLVYWAHHLHPEANDIAVVDEKHPLYLEDPYVPSTGKPAPKPSSWRRKTLGFFEKILDKVMLNDDLTVRYSSIADSLIRKHFKDLEDYYCSECVSEVQGGRLVRDVIRDDLRKVLYKYRRWDILLVSHSMGSIIAYDVLSELEKDHGVHTLVTMGSPLGLPTIIARQVQQMREVNREVETVTTPQSVRTRWYNLSDLEDRVAFNYDLGDDYAPNDRGVAAEDKIVFNDYEVKGKANHHKSYGYLRTREMAEILHSFITEGRSERWLRVSDKFHEIWDRFKSWIGSLRAGRQIP